jgi:hypothetical protein
MIWAATALAENVIFGAKNEICCVIVVFQICLLFSDCDDIVGESWCQCYKKIFFAAEDEAK